MAGSFAVAAFAGCIFFQSSFPPCLEIAGTHPDLVLILMCYLAETDCRRSLLWAAFCAGLLLDVFSGFPLGINAFSKAVIVLVIQTRHNAGVRSDSKDWAMMIAFASLCDGVITLFMIRALTTYHIYPLATVSTLAASMLYTTIASIPVASVLARLERVTAPQHRRPTVRS